MSKLLFDEQPTSKLLFDKQPVVINVELARLIGLNESIVLQQVDYLIEINKEAGENLKKGRFWIYNSMESWQQENFPFWSIDTVKRIFTKLINLGFLITDCFNKQSFDKTKWYTIDYEKLESLNL
jgi:hypothetical protein